MPPHLTHTMLNASKREKTLAILAGAAVAVLMLDRVWLRPLLAAWQETSRAIVTKQTELERSRTLIDNAAAIQRQWAKMSQEIAKAQRSASFQSYLDTIERVAGVTENNRKSLADSEVKGKKVENYSLALSGDLGGVVRFLNTLADSPRLLRVKQLSIRSKEKTATLDIDAMIAAMAPENLEVKEEAKP